MDDISRFFSFLYEKDTGYVYSPLKKKDGTWVENYFLWPAEAQNLHDWVQTASHDGNVYVAPALFKERRAKKDAFQHSNVCWIEFDGQESPDFKDIPAPDVIVQTSSASHVHCYWKIAKLPQEALEELNRRLMYHLRADNSGWDSVQVLRPPNTTNWKHNLPVSLIKFSPPIFKHKIELFDSAPEVTKEPLLLTYEDVEDVSVILSRYSLPAELVTMVTKQLPVNGDRSVFLMRCGYLLAAADIEEKEIVSLLYHIDTRIKKFVGRSDQLLRLAEIAAIAKLEYNKIYNVDGYSPLEILNSSQTLEWILQDWLHTTGIMLVSGLPGTGKTQFCMDMGYHLATGTSFIGKAPYQPVKVGFISLEMDVVEMKYIVEHQAGAWTDKQLYSLYDSNFKVYPPEDERSFMVYENIIKRNRPAVIIIDSVSELASDDLKEGEARVIMAWIKKMVRDYKCAFVLIHHNRKPSDSNKKPRKLGDLYGSYLLAKNASTVISLWDTEKNGILEIDPFKIRFGKRDTVAVKRSEHLTFEKQELKINVGGQPGKTNGTNELLRLLD